MIYLRNNTLLLLISLCSSFLLSPRSEAQIVPGPVSDFESGTNEGWAGGSSPTNIPDGGPTGTGDNFLRIEGGINLATFNTQLSGELDSSVTGFQVDLMRPSGQSDFDLRLVLFGPTTDDRWTSTVAAVVPGTGNWATYTFSVLEEDLTRVTLFGDNDYSDLVAGVNRTMLRYDPGAPDFGGAFVTGSLGIDNVTVLADSGGITGDYDGNGTVGTEDYALWKANFGSTADLAADGNDSGEIDAGDYTIWRDNLPSSTAAVPEPASWLLMCAAFIVTRCRRSRD